VVFGPSCPQVIPGIARPIGVRGERDDTACLVLNVFSHSADDARRPVMVWIHGGAFVLGSADMYDAAHFAASGEIVVVTINYRLGMLGFLDLGSALGEPGLEGNIGLRDQIAALRWVRDNIAAFGGDPGRVTIAGESAGSVSVSMLMVCPEASGLFHGAILQSGALTIAHEAPRARAVALRFLELLGISSPSIAALQALPVQQVLQAQHALQAEIEGRLPGLPWFDGVLLPGSLEAARLAPTPPVPLLAGFNRDEYRSFEFLPQGRGGGRRSHVAKMLRKGLGPALSHRLMSVYPMDRDGNRQLATDLYFAMPTLHFAERHARHAACWFYRFDIAHPLLAAGHGLDLLYLFDINGILALLLRGGRLAGSRGSLARRMRRHWLGFIRDGRPGAAWPAFATPERATLLFNRVDRVVRDPEATRRRAWLGRDVVTGAVGDADPEAVSS
jgi:para-nitrobenzyl esterase